MASQERSQLYVYELQCVCCRTPFKTIERTQITCGSTRCYLFWYSHEQFAKQYLNQTEDGSVEIDFFDVLLG